MLKLALQTFHKPGPMSLIQYIFIGKWKAFKCKLMHVEYKNHGYPYYMCMKFFCPYQALQFETTHMKNCSLIPAQLLLIVLTTLTKGAKQNKIVCQAPSSRCDAHQACNTRQVQVHRLRSKALCSNLLSPVY
jgi:hypothetical protein